MATQTFPLMATSKFPTWIDRGQGFNAGTVGTCGQDSCFGFPLSKAAAIRCYPAGYANIQFLEIWRLNRAHHQIHTDYSNWYVHGKWRFTLLDFPGLKGLT